MVPCEFDADAVVHGDKWYFPTLPGRVPLEVTTSKFHRMFRPSRTALLALPLVALAACGGSSAPAETLPANLSLTVTAVPSLKFDAASYGPVKAGEVSIGYVNKDNVRHTLIIAKDDTKVPAFKLVIAENGSVDSGTVTLEAGTYKLLCDVPGHSNMKATLTVEP